MEVREFALSEKLEAWSPKPCDFPTLRTVPKALISYLQEGSCWNRLPRGVNGSSSLRTRQLGQAVVGGDLREENVGQTATLSSRRSIAQSSSSSHLVYGDRFDTHCEVLHVVSPSHMFKWVSFTLSSFPTDFWHETLEVLNGYEKKKKKTNVIHLQMWQHGQLPQDLGETWKHGRI